VLRNTFLSMSNSKDLQDIALHNGAARRFALRFVAGETLAQATRAIMALNSKGIMATFDHLGENVSTADEAIQALRPPQKNGHLLRVRGASGTRFVTVK